MKLPDLIEKYKHLTEPKFRHLDFEKDLWIKIIFEHSGDYWALNSKGFKVTIEKTYAEEPKWAIFLVPRKVKYLAYYNGVAKQMTWLQKEYPIMADVYRVEQFDFEIEVIE